jgi:hypothetical protein
MSLSSITEGTQLHAKYAADGEFYPAVVVATSTSKNRAKKPVKVSYNGFDEDAWVALDELKSKKLGLPSSTAEPEAKAKAKAKEKAEPKAKAAKVEPKAEPKAKGNDELSRASSAVLDDNTMKAILPNAVYKRFKDNLVTGAATSEEDMKAIAKAIFGWARGLGAVAFAHWFFPMRGGGGGTGGVCGAFKMDTLIDLEWSSKEASKPFVATLPY